MDSLMASLSGLAQIIWLNAILSGDNAVVIGLAAAGLPAAQRRRAVLLGVLAAAGLRVVFAVFASALLALWWVELAGAAALLWIAATFLGELLRGAAEDAAAGAAGEAAGGKSLGAALWQIVVADVSMSLDNVLAVAAVARSDIALLATGLAVSVVMMGVLGGWLARILQRYKVIAYVGVALIGWIGLELLWDGMIAANSHLELGLPLPAPAHP